MPKSMPLNIIFPFYLSCVYYHFQSRYLFYQDIFLSFDSFQFFCLITFDTLIYDETLSLFQVLIIVFFNYFFIHFKAYLKQLQYDLHGIYIHIY